MAYQLMTLRSQQRVNENRLAHLLLRLFSLDHPEGTAFATKARMQATLDAQPNDTLARTLLDGAERGLTFIAEQRRTYEARVNEMDGLLSPASVEVMARLATRRAAPYRGYFLFGGGPFATTELQQGISEMVQACQIDSVAHTLMLGLLSEGWLVEAHQRTDDDHKVMRGYKVEYHLAGHHGAYWHPKEFEEFLIQRGPLSGCHLCHDVSALYAAQTERIMFEVCYDCMNHLSRGAAIHNCDRCGRPFIVEGAAHVLCVDCRMARVAIA